MTPETATEWYQFTCPRCQTRLTVRYQVRRVTDDAGQTRSFYTRHRLPCEAPARAQVTCPSCGHAPIRAELLGTPPASGLAAAPAAANAGHHAAPHRHGPLDASRRFTFKAVISLSLDSPHGRHPRQPTTQDRWETRALMVRVPDPDGTGSFLPAVITRDDEQPLRPGDSHVIVTISVPGGEAPGLFSPGSHFALWAGTDVGSGTVSRRVFFS